MTVPVDLGEEAQDPLTVGTGGLRALSPWIGRWLEQTLLEKGLGSDPHVQPRRQAGEPWLSHVTGLFLTCGRRVECLPRFMGSVRGSNEALYAQVLCMPCRGRS